MANRNRFLMLNRQDTQSYTNDDLREEVIEDVELLKSLGANFGQHEIVKTVITSPKVMGYKSVGQTRRTGDQFVIRLNQEYLRLTTDPVQIHSTIMHEVIHCLEGCWNHKAEFQRWAKIVNAVYGLKVKTHSAATEYIAQYVDKDVVRWAVFCPQCQQIIARRKRKSALITAIMRNDGSYQCKACGCKNLEVKEIV